MKEKKYTYQMVLVFAPKTESKAIDGVWGKLAAFLDSVKAEIIKKENLGTKELVYEIQKHRKGDFWELTVESTKPVKVTDINIFLNRDVSVIRYLVLKN
ncbi:30S ribosomal protein S6 [Candidatus Shapirobacteria bacterium]|nr:30S ribosomal protein S6 [Candidatus Shapirobacteria bacterium]